MEAATQTHWIVVLWLSRSSYEDRGEGGQGDIVGFAMAHCEIKDILRSNWMFNFIHCLLFDLDLHRVGKLDSNPKSVSPHPPLYAAGRADFALTDLSVSFYRLD